MHGRNRANASMSASAAATNEVRSPLNPTRMNREEVEVRTFVRSRRSKGTVVWVLVYMLFLSSATAFAMRAKGGLAYYPDSGLRMCKPSAAGAGCSSECECCSPQLHCNATHSICSSCAAAESPCSFSSQCCGYREDAYCSSRKRCEKLTLKSGMQLYVRESDGSGARASDPAAHVPKVSGPYACQLECMSHAWCVVAQFDGSNCDLFRSGARLSRTPIYFGLATFVRADDQSDVRSILLGSSPGGMECMSSGEE